MYKPLTIATTVATAGTRVRLSASSLPAASVYFEAGAVTGSLFVGNVSVASSLYMCKLTTGQGFKLDAPSRERPGNEIDLANIYVDAQTAGAVLYTTYLTRVGNV